MVTPHYFLLNSVNHMNTHIFYNILKCIIVSKTFLRKVMCKKNSNIYKIFKNFTTFCSSSWCHSKNLIIHLGMFHGFMYIYKNSCMKKTVTADVIIQLTFHCLLFIHSCGLWGIIRLLYSICQSVYKASWCGLYMRFIWKELCIMWRHVWICTCTCWIWTERSLCNANTYL